MAKYWMWKILWIALLLLISKVYCDFTRVTTFDLMKCFYGDRGSLTATCVNATPSFFKHTIYKFDHLDETLQCVNCTLKIIESNTFDLSGNHIKFLNLKSSLIESLKPKAFMGLIFLEDLNLSDNYIKSIFPGTFNGTKKIISVDLSRNKISILSEDGFSELINLQRLTLRDNLIQLIAEQAFNGLISLKELDLSGNNIMDISNAFENLSSLEVLNLSENKLYRLIGNEFSSLKNLTECHLSKNNLSNSAIEMIPGNQLRIINFSYNSMEVLLPSLVNLNALEELDLSHNNIADITHHPLENMVNLHNLNLAYNKLLQLRTGTFSGLPQLRELDCSHNLIGEVVITGVFSLHSLHTLDLSHNKLTDIDYSALISRIPGLSYLKLDYNSLSCDLEEEMETYFAEDNFKYILYDNILGSPKCVNKPSSNPSYKALHDSFVEKRVNYVTTADIWLFILLSCVIIAIVILFYIQYLFYKGMEFCKPRRVASTVQLISSEADIKEEEFLNDIS